MLEKGRQYWWFWLWAESLAGAAAFTRKLWGPVHAEGNGRELRGVRGSELEGYFQSTLSLNVFPVLADYSKIY